MNYPSNIPVETPVGQVNITITDGAHIYAEAPNHIHISGKELVFTCHFFLRNGEWSEKSDKGNPLLYCKKPACWKNDEATPIQKEKALKAIVPAIAQYIKANPQLLVAAHLADVNDNIESIQHKIDEARKEIAKLEAELVKEQKRLIA